MAFHKFSPPRHLTLFVHAKPGARLSKLHPATASSPSLNISLSARPVDGAANAALCEFLAELCKCRRSDVVVVGGAMAREKVVRVELRSDCTVEQVDALIEQIIRESNE